MFKTVNIVEMHMLLYRSCLISGFLQITAGQMFNVIDLN
jgi:hypothetical protein